MPNKTMFSDDELNVIKSIANGLRTNKFAEARIKDRAHSFYLDHAADPNERIDLVVESWTLAVVQYLVASGYEIKKKA